MRAARTLALRRALVGVLLLFAAGMHDVEGQTARATVSAAIVPDTLRVGDVVRAALRVRLPLNARVQFPDTLAVAGDVEAAGARQIRTDTIGDQLEVTAIYPITAWRPGPIELPATAVFFSGEAGVDSLVAEFPEARVLTVLPEDTAGIEARPAKDVFGGDRIWWPLIAGLALLLALAALLYWLWSRRERGAPLPLMPATPSAREAALALLERARTLRLVEKGDLKAFYSLVTEAVRGYMEAVEPAWGADLTTAELAPRLSAHGAGAADEALRVLDRADLVKFARFQPDATIAYGDWSLAHDWIERFDGPAPAQPADAEVETVPA